VDEASSQISLSSLVVVDKRKNTNHYLSPCGPFVIYAIFAKRRKQTSRLQKKMRENATTRGLTVELVGFWT
jgi:hypothetical protein